MGTGFLGTMASVAAGSAMGHVIGRSMMNMFEGRDTQEVVNEIESTPVAQEDGACPVQFKAFKMCLESTGDDVSQCQWAYDMFRDCAERNTTTSMYSGY